MRNNKKYLEEEIQFSGKFTYVGADFGIKVDFIKCIMNISLT